MSSDTLPDNPLFKQIDHQVKTTPVVLYMKGTADIPQCGFSSLVVQILNKLQVSFVAVDVLKDPVLRQGIKDYTQWPTIPQLYVGGEFVGGSDIVREMYQTGELVQTLQSKGIACVTPPSAEKE